MAVQYFILGYLSCLLTISSILLLSKLYEFFNNLMELLEAVYNLTEQISGSLNKLVKVSTNKNFKKKIISEKPSTNFFKELSSRIPQIVTLISNCAPVVASYYLATTRETKEQSSEQKDNNKDNLNEVLDNKNNLSDALNDENNLGDVLNDENNLGDVLGNQNCHDFGDVTRLRKKRNTPVRFNV